MAVELKVVEDAILGIMGRFDAGEFTLRGAVTIDFEICTITDEKDPAIVFGEGTATGD